MLKQHEFGRRGLDALEGSWAAVLTRPLRCPGGGGALEGGRAAQEHLACFFPGNMALGVWTGAVSGPKADRYLQVARVRRRPHGPPHRRVPPPATAPQLPGRLRCGIAWRSSPWRGAAGL